MKTTTEKFELVLNPAWNSAPFAFVWIYKNGDVIEDDKCLIRYDENLQPVYKFIKRTVN